MEKYRKIQNREDAHYWPFQLGREPAVREHDERGWMEGSGMGVRKTEYCWNVGEICATRSLATRRAGERARQRPSRTYTRASLRTQSPRAPRTKILHKPQTRAPCVIAVSFNSRSRLSRVTLIIFNVRARIIHIFNPAKWFSPRWLSSRNVRFLSFCVTLRSSAF